MDGVAVWLEREPVCVPNRLRVRSQFLRSRGIPAVTYIDDAWQSSPAAAREKEPREQWLAAAEGLRLAVALSACAGFFLSIAKCDLVPTLSLRYLGLIYAIVGGQCSAYRVTNYAGSANLS